MFYRLWVSKGLATLCVQSAQSRTNASEIAHFVRIVCSGLYLSLVSYTVLLSFANHFLLNVSFKNVRVTGNFSGKVALPQRHSFLHS